MTNLMPVYIVLMNRDGLSEAEAREKVRRGQEQVRDLISDDWPDHLAAKKVLRTVFGLEPDYSPCLLN